MLKLRKLSGKVYQSLFYHFKVLLQYKSKLYDNKLVIADRWFPSTQLCNCCGQTKTKETKLKLSDRNYICECGYTNDRDINASLNLRDYGLINN
jgi:putative transposase